MSGIMKMIAALALLSVAIPSANAFAAPATRKVVRKAPAKPVKPTDWTKRVVMTPQGGFLTGNPAAKAKFVEYASLTCPYCKRFHREASAGLRARIATGEVSFEFRPFAVHSADPILHALMRCAGPARHVKFADDFFDRQTALAATYEAWVEANPVVNPNATAADRIRFSDEWGFTAFATAHGLTRPQVATCLSNVAAFQLQRQQEDQANTDFGVAGTPSFLLNGQPLSLYTWPEIDQAISVALTS